MVSRAYSGKTMRVVRNELHRVLRRAIPTSSSAFPDQLGRAFSDGVMHLGADETNEEVDPARECFPAGQGVGGIGELVPAATLVQRFVDEAEAVVAGLASRSGPPA